MEASAQAILLFSAVKSLVFFLLTPGPLWQTGAMHFFPVRFSFWVRANQRVMDPAAEPSCIEASVKAFWGRYQMYLRKYTSTLTTRNPRAIM